MAGIHRRKIWDSGGWYTPEAAFLSRRRFLRASTSAIGIACAGGLIGCDERSDAQVSEERTNNLPATSSKPFVAGERNAKYVLDRALTKESVAARYNNFYEFTTNKGRVWMFAQSLTTQPWTVEITGEVARPMTIDVDDLVRKMPIEERLYRFRCVEAWAMAVPWTGFALKSLLDLVEPTSRAKFVRFVTFLRPAEAAGQRRPTSWSWPYHEALTIDEAVNELTLMATGIYGHSLPKQHGAPLRLVVPWKYGFKSIKSIVKIELTQTQPQTFWNDAVPREYDFWANVNPKKPHPRWSQARERLIDTNESVDTMPYNGYGRYVHEMYKGNPWAAL